MRPNGLSRYQRIQQSDQPAMTTPWLPVQPWPVRTAGVCCLGRNPDAAILAPGRGLPGCAARAHSMRNQPVASPAVGEPVSQAPEQPGQASVSPEEYGLQEEDHKLDRGCQEQEQDKAENGGQEQEKNDDD
jgi:hypothetical protein